MAEVQANHWWFAARRRILAALLQRLALPAHAHILEAGCGPGGNLPMLARFGQLSAMEMDAGALDAARCVRGVDVRRGWLPDGIPFGAGERFDVICLFDVLEHVADDLAALRALAGLLRDGGCVVVTAPAYQWLYGPHDQAHHHFRRYTARGIESVARTAGYRCRQLGYFNALLFPLMLAARLLAKLGLAEGTHDARMPGLFVNRILAAVFAAERHVVARGGFPFGASVVAVLERDV